MTTSPCPRCARPASWARASLTDGACTRERYVSGCCYAVFDPTVRGAHVAALLATVDSAQPIS